METEIDDEAEIRVGGKALSPDVRHDLREVRAESSLLLPDEIRLTFHDESFALYDRQIFAMGDSLEVLLAGTGALRSVASGEVSSIAIEPGPDQAQMLVVTAHGRDHGLHRGAVVETYVDQTDAQIAQAIASRHKLKADVESSNVRYAHVLQAASDHDFLTARADRIGYRWWVRGDTLHFRSKVPRSTGPSLAHSDNLVSLRVHMSSAGATRKHEVRTWNSDAQQPVTVAASPEFDLDGLGSDAPGPVAAAKAAAGLSRTGDLDTSEPTQDAESADALAGALAQRQTDGLVALRAVALGDPALAAGVTVSLEGVGDSLSGNYRLTSALHVYSPTRGYRTTVSTAGPHARELADLVGRRGTRQGTWEPRSLVIGVVTQLEDAEHPGRVKVSFPSLDDSLESDWARLVLPGAGEGRGLQLCPEINDEVLVGFENGDVARPLVMGGLWSTKTKPPTATDTLVKAGKTAVRSLRTRAGHEITINDAEADNPDQIVIALAKDKGTLTIGVEGVKLASQADIEISSEASLTINAKGDLSLTGDKVTVNAGSDLLLEGKDLTASGRSSTAIEGSTVDLKGTGGLTVDGGTATQIKGGTVKLN